ncbi:hypothetical protein PoB_000702100 [Plakobranchus ocellatus]|uniref:Secreted protein n=1 Tax=Plakobranchus ocellatus TaxID=259542 RepID=A0AAV3YDP7_9GAST|nr:hypothetical protein PoB_000702100 [Plakobranchus ocellatus]
MHALFFIAAPLASVSNVNFRLLRKFSNELSICEVRIYLVWFFSRDTFGASPKFCNSHVSQSQIFLCHCCAVLSHDTVPENRPVVASYQNKMFNLARRPENRQHVVEVDSALCGRGEISPRKGLTVTGKIVGIL